MATDQPPKLRSPSVVDAAVFTQSEILSLSRCSHSSALDQPDVLIPEIDSSIFNESAATRRQTYSEIRPSKPRKKRSGKSPVRAVRLERQSSDSDGDENRLIVRLLKDLIKTSPLHDPADVERRNLFNAEMRECDGDGGHGKRKRGRAKTEVVDEEIVNMNGVVVDLVALESVLDPYGEELRRRTAGLVSEEECLGFLSGLNGKWVSRRRKRRIVDACEFGDHLPVRWKLLLALRRREGRIWLYCRRYISPGGREFVSCKDVALYLHSLFDFSKDPMVDVNMGNIQNNGGTLLKEGTLGNEDVPLVALPASSAYDEQGSLVAVQGIEKLLDVQVSSLFECYQCKLVFLEKKFYLEHVLSSHEKTTKRYRLGSQVKNGVILDIGHYECQFCYIIFQEKDSYSRHVELHFRGKSDELLDRTFADTNSELFTLSNNGILKSVFKCGDASIINVPNHILDASTVVGNDESLGGLIFSKPNVAASDGNLCKELVSEIQAISENHDRVKELGNQVGNKVSLTDDVDHHAAQHSMFPGSWIQDHSGKSKNCGLEMISVACLQNSQTVNKFIANTDTHIKQNVNENVVTSCDIASSRDFGKSILMAQPSDLPTEFSPTPCEGEELGSYMQKPESVAGFGLDYCVQPVNELETNTDSYMKQNSEHNVMTSSGNVSSGDFGELGLVVKLLGYPTELTSAPCKGEELSIFNQKLETVPEVKYSLQTINELKTYTDSSMKQNVQQNVMISSENVSSGDFVKLGSTMQLSDHITEFRPTQCEEEELSSLRQKPESVAEFKLDFSVQTGSMVRPSDHHTELSSAPWEGEELSRFRQKLGSAAEFELELESTVQTVNELETNPDTCKKQNLEQNMMTFGENVPGAFGQTGSMVQPSDHLSSVPCEEKLKSVTEFELDYALQPANELKTKINTHMEQNLEQNVMTSDEIVSSGYFGQSVSAVQLSNHLPDSYGREGEGLSSFRLKLDSIAEFDELNLGDIEPLTFSFRTGEESLPRPVAPMDIKNDAEVNAFSSTRVGVEDNLCSVECRCQIAAVCVWCNSEFIYEVSNSELQSDCVGYMCTSCRAKISAQFIAPAMVYP